MNNRNSNSAGMQGVGLVPRSVQLDFEREEKKIQQFETVNKKFYKDVKNYVEKLDDLIKSENKMLNNVSNFSSSVCESSTTANSSSTSQQGSSNTASAADSLNLDKEMFSRLKSIKDLLIEHTKQCEHFKQTCQASVIEPMKNLNLVFPQVYQAIKRREQSLKELIKHQKQLEKLQDKEHTGPNLVRLNEVTQLVQHAKIQFNKENSILMEELPKFYNSRVDYIRPCVNCLIKNQLDFYDKYKSFYDSLLESLNGTETGSVINRDISNDHRLSLSKKESTLNQGKETASASNVYENVDSDDEINELSEDVQKLLADIKSLSIVAAD
jgi:hypothetical protein